MNDQLFEPRTCATYHCEVSKKSVTFKEVYDLFVGFSNLLDCPSICLMERTCHSTSLTTFHSTSTNNLTTLHALLPGNIPQSFNGRLSEISYSKESFEKAASICQKALDNSGYKYLLTFSLHIFTQIQNLEEKIGRETSFGTAPI